MENVKKDPPKKIEKNNKNPSGLKRFSKYLRELSVVVIGVAITFIGSNWISNRQEEKKLQSHLEAVKTELEDNLVEMRKGEIYYERLARLTHYLGSDQPENLSQEKIDQLNIYEDYFVVSKFLTMPVKTSAFEMMKASGTMSRIKNPDLSQAILDSYTSLGTTKYESDNYMSVKITEMRNSIMDNEEIFYGDILNPKFRRIFYFFAAYLDMQNLFKESGEQIEKTLSLL